MDVIHNVGSVIGALVRIVPLVQRKPAEGQHPCDKDKSQNACDGGGGKKSGVFGLAAIDDSLKSEPAAIAG